MKERGGKKNMPLLRTSDFCRRQPSRIRQRHHQSEEDHRRLHQQQRLPIRLINSSPSRTRTKQNNNGDEDINFVGYAPAKVFVFLSLQQDSYVYVCHQHQQIPSGCVEAPATSSYSIKRVIIRLKLLEEEGDEEEPTKEMKEDYFTAKPLGNNDSVTSSDVMLNISPMVATNLGLGLHQFGNDDKYNCIEEKDCCWLEIPSLQHRYPKNASRVVLRPIGCQPTQSKSWPHMLLSLNNNDNQEEEKWIFPTEKSLIQSATIISVHDKSNQTTKYYDTLEITPQQEDDDDNVNKIVERSTRSTAVTPAETAMPSFFQITSSTEFVLDRSPLSSPIVRRLPPLYEPYYQKTPDKDTPRCIIPLHPNIPEISKWLQHIPASSSSSSTASGEMVLHVIGKDRDHNVRVAIETAAHLAGMQCLSIRGLSAFAHHFAKASDDPTTVVRTGSIQDQLAGLQAAMKYIRQQCMEPCVLHLQDFDTELSSIDQPTRHDQEERFWSLWTRTMTETTKSSHTTTSGRVNREDSTSINSCCWAPRMCLILSTSSPLKPGPLMEKLVFQSIELNLPDVAYMKHLWGKAGSREELDWSDDLIELLEGRSAQEILEIRQEAFCFYSDGSKKNDNNGGEQTSTMIKRLRGFCIEIDEGRRKQSSNLSQISNVHWEDVGGLAHVRIEIMDAIELPLQHPHLFPKNGGRSGILLYGPPGTGKTLVAKAVATECRLPFLSVKGPELLGSYVGESEANIRDVFASARDAALKNAPTSACILFFDELDSLAPRRGGVGDGGGVMERVVATLFAELDTSGDVDSGRVFVMGATNRPDLLDPSLLRSGRFERLVYLGIPTDTKERTRVLTAQLRKLRLERSNAEELAWSVVQTLPARLTGADMSTIASGALLNAVHRLCRKADKEQELILERDGKHVSIEDIIEGWDEDSKTPTVCLEDLQAAAKDVSPSVTESELLRYERLRDEFSSKSGEATLDVIEHDGDVFYG